MVSAVATDEPEIAEKRAQPTNHPLVDEKDIAALKSKIGSSGLTVSELVSTAWASASTSTGCLPG